MKRFFALLAALVLSMANLCGAQAQEDRLAVVTTIFPEYDFARAVGAEHADITMLIKPGAESHSYEPSPMDIVAIQKCDVFICVGGENDAWAQKILSGLDTSNMHIVYLMDIVEPLAQEHGHPEEHGHEDEHEHEYDEHVWTSPINAMAIVSQIGEVFAQADPAHADDYRANAAAYNEEIAKVDARFREIMQEAVRTELVFGDRFPFLYFAREYGIEWVSAFPGCSTDAEVSAATVAELIDLVKAKNIPAVLYMELSAHRVADTICAETGAKGMLLHSCHNVTREEFDAGETYVSLMLKNCDTLWEALCK